MLRRRRAGDTIEAIARAYRLTPGSVRRILRDWERS
jgi:hypothetical protein